MGPLAIVSQELGPQIVRSLGLLAERKDSNSRTRQVRVDVGARMRQVWR
jgi:hypothetical protein